MYDELTPSDIRKMEEEIEYRKLVVRKQALEDVRALKALGIHGAIIGKAYYTGAIDLRQAVEEML